MNRRDSIAALVALGAAPLAAEAQQPAKLVRIAYLGFGRPEASSHLVDALKQGMRVLGYIEGKDVVFEVRWALGDVERLSQLAKETVALNPDVIVSLNGSAVRALQQATTTIPIVFGTLSDPVGTGVVKSLARPGGNITGLSTLAADYGPKLLELMMTVVPKLSRVAMMYGSDLGVSLRQNLLMAARSVGVDVVAIEVQTPSEIASAFARMTNEKTAAVIGLPSGLLYQQRTQFAELASRNRIPSVFAANEYAEAGALMSYGSDYSGTARDAARYVDRILKGARPGDLPVEQASKFELVINLKTARQIGVTVPQSLLIRADRVIE